jgi:phenylalanyl-tRNA synthetase alpha chain
MKSNLNSLVTQTRQALSSVSDLTQLEKIRSSILGKQGKLTDYLKQIQKFSSEERQAINETKQTLQALFSETIQTIQTKLLENKLRTETIDITLPGCGQTMGALHPVTYVRHRIETLLTQMGFMLVEGPEIEDDYHNFTALNIPPDHPARASHDTFYLKNGLLLRTHTSPVQIRAMRQYGLPLSMIASGRVYRCDSDITHTPMFHQVEGLCINQSTNFAQLKGLLTYFLQHFFDQPNLKIRFRPAYFPFTEPSAEVDAQCVLCLGKGCRLCKNSGWLELLGCGMVHPSVLQQAHIDPENYRAYAFGMGVERLALIRYGITDLRMLYEHDVRFLEQFKHEIQ